MAEWRRARERRRQEIVEAACRVFARQGVDRTTIREVQREAGLSAGAVYSYFPSKEALRRAATATVMASLATTVARALRRQAGTAPAEAAAATADAVAATGPPIELVFDLLLAARRDADASASVRTALARALTACTAAARRMADEGRLPPDADPEATGLTMLYLIVGTLATRLHPSEDVSADEGFPFPPSLDLTETGGP